MIRIRNWDRLQHFKNRKPPWIKLYRDILDQLDINLISDRSFRVLIGLWLLASEDEAMEGNLPPLKDISFRLRLPEKDILKAFQELGAFIESDDITMISRRYQDDTPETETETETETEKRQSVQRQSLFQEFWDKYPKKQAKQDAAKAFKKLNPTPELLSQMLDAIITQVDSPQWKREEGKYIPLPATWLNGKRWEDQLSVEVEEDDPFAFLAKYPDKGVKPC